MSTVALFSSCIIEPCPSAVKISSYKPRNWTPTKPIRHHRKNRYLQGTRRLRAVSESVGSLPDPLAISSSWYHPSEDIEESVSDDDGARLSDAEIARTLVEVNNKATLTFSGLTDDEIFESVIWPDLSYLTDENGYMYFVVSNNEDVLQTLTGDDKIVQVIIGLDNIDLLDELEMTTSSDFDFGIEDITNNDIDIDADDSSDEDSFTIVEDDDVDLFSSESSNIWTNLETMKSSHPLYFARKVAETVSNINMDFMEQPSASIFIKGVLRPVSVEENSFLKKHLSGAGTNIDTIKEGEDNDQSLKSGTAIYKLEIIRIQVVSSDGTQTSVEVEDFQNTQPDVVHRSEKIISELEADGDKTFQALKSLCWRLKNIQVEEASIILIDSLGFDMRVCSGTEVQTLRFAFDARATSEVNAEKKLHDLLFTL